VGQWRELTQLQLSALIQFTASLGEIITALKPVSTVQRGSRTKAPILSFKYSPRVSGMLWRGRGALELSHCEWRSVYTTPVPRTHVPRSHTHAGFPQHRRGDCHRGTVTPWFSGSGHSGSGKLQNLLCQAPLLDSGDRMMGSLGCLWGEKKVNPSPGHGHISSLTEAAPAATLSKPNPFNFSPVIRHSTSFTTKVQPLFAKTSQVTASHTASRAPLQLPPFLHFTAAGSDFHAPRFPSAWSSCSQPDSALSCGAAGLPTGSTAVKRRRLGHSVAGQKACRGTYALYGTPKTSTTALPHHKTQWVTPLPSLSQHYVVHSEGKHLRS